MAAWLAGQSHVSFESGRWWLVSIMYVALGNALRWVHTRQWNRCGRWAVVPVAVSSEPESSPLGDLRGLNRYMHDWRAKPDSRSLGLVLAHATWCTKWGNLLEFGWLESPNQNLWSIQLENASGIFAWKYPQCPWRHQGFSPYSWGDLVRMCSLQS